MKIKTLEKIELEDIDKIIHAYDTQSQAYWDNERKNTLELSFTKASTNIPAYKKFLKEQGVSRFGTKASDLRQIPPINKKNYFRHYRMAELFDQRKGLKQALITTSTSGSTGEPTYFFRSEELDLQYAVLANYFLSNNNAKGSTLLINCFGMGVWIGGLITYEAFRLAGIKGNPITIIAPGVNKKEIFHALRKLAPNFDNLIISGYPPFIKDIIDEAKQENIDFKKFHTRFLFAAESFTEEFRDYLCKQAYVKDPVRDTLNIYGSAELGAMAFETPLSIFIRRLALKNKKVYNRLFSHTKLPTLAQYNPKFVAFEEQNGEVLISAPNVLPLVRYQIGDSGGVYTYAEIEKIFQDEGIKLLQELKKSNIRMNFLPFVYVFERNDLSTTLYGLQVYPQTVKKALEKPPLNSYVTGKFSMLTKFNKKNDQYLEINIELKPKVKEAKKLKNKIEETILNQLLKENSEFRELQSMIKERAHPLVHLWSYNDPKYFRSGIKQQWVQKTI